jgi:hypothetical protein
MTHQSCEGCTYLKPSHVYGMACFRPKRFMSGHRANPSSEGFSTLFETGHPDLYEGRTDGDNCGEERRHWRAIA